MADEIFLEKTEETIIGAEVLRLICGYLEGFVVDFHQTLSLAEKVILINSMHNWLDTVARLNGGLPLKDERFGLVYSRIKSAEEMMKKGAEKSYK